MRQTVQTVVRRLKLLYTPFDSARRSVSVSCTGSAFTCSRLLSSQMQSLQVRLGKCRNSALAAELHESTD